MLLLAAGQPLFAEDTWWHLGMGEAYARAGPWLDADPFLFTASGPPTPAAWLADWILYSVHQLFGFSGLRGFHALCVAAILAAVWHTLRRGGNSRSFASLGTCVFAALSAYRLFQLRPHLFTILLSVLLVGFLVRVCDARRLSSGGCVALALLLLVWANLHAGFVLGLLLIAAALVGSGVAAALPSAERGDQRARARWLAFALVVAAAASLANPSGARSHLLLIAGGLDTPALEVVADEWAPLDLRARPSLHTPPSPLSWLLIPLLGLACIAFALAWLRGSRRATAELDAPLFAMSLAALAATFGALRLAWLCFIPLLFVGRACAALGLTGDRTRVGRARAAGVAAIALLVGLGFWRVGAWPAISRGVSPDVYARPYPAAKFRAHATWFLRDAELDGRAWTDYRYANFFGYWLAPRLRFFVNGSLNVPQAVMRAHFAIRRGRGTDGADLLELLDRYQVDVFVGTGLPATAAGRRPSAVTTSHLERAPGWTLVFRSLSSAVYLRDHERNERNFERVATYYAARDVPFDPARGLEVGRVLREAETYSVAHGMAPPTLGRLARATRSLDPLRGPDARERYAGLLALLGDYEAALRVDELQLSRNPQTLTAARRALWCALHLDAEVGAASERLEAVAHSDDALSRALLDAALGWEDLTRDAARERLAQLRPFSEAQIRRSAAGVKPPAARASGS